MSAIGVDFGSEKTVIAVARNRGIDIIVNEVSNRFTPTMVGFTNENRLLGEAAKTQEVMNYRNTATSIKRLLGRRFDEDDIHSTEEKYLNCELAESSTGEVGVKTTYQGVEQVFSMTQIVGMFLTQVKQTAENAINSPVSDVVISTPAYYTDRQLTALLNASEIAGLNCVRLLNESTSAALLYGITKARELPEKEPRHVCFVDIGQASMTVSVVAFTQAEANVKGTAFDRNLGGRSFDDILIEYFANEIKAKHKIDISELPKAKLRLKVACEKLKKILSANSVAPMHIENLTNEVDVHSELGREAFEKMSFHILERIESPIRVALHSAGVRKDQIESVELIGGTTRIPAVKERIQKFFDRENILSTTINADEAVCRGCAFQCAMISPLFKVRDYNVKDVTPYDIKVTWQGTDGEQHELDVFTENEAIPSTKALTFARSSPFEFAAMYKKPSALPVGSPLEIGRYMVNDVKPNKEGGNSDVRIKVRINPHGVFGVISAQAIEQVPVAEETPASSTTNESGEAAATAMDVDDKSAATGAAPAAAADSMETDAPPKSEEPTVAADVNASTPSTPSTAAPAAAAAASGANAVPGAAPTKKAKVTKTDLPVVATSSVLDKKTVESLRELEAKMAASDKLVFDTLLKKNSLEEYIYDIRGKIETTHSEFVEEAVREQFMQKLTEMEDWLYSEGEQATKGVYVEKLTSLQAIGNPCHDRFVESEQRPQEEQQLRKAIDYYRSQAATTDEKFAHIEEAERAKLVEECAKVESWLNDMVAKQAAIPKYQPVVVTCKEIKSRTQQLTNFGNSIMNKPKPKPKEEPPKDMPPPPPPADQTPDAASTAAADGAANAETPDSSARDAMETDAKEDSASGSSSTKPTEMDLD